MLGAWAIWSGRELLLLRGRVAKLTPDGGPSLEGRVLALAEGLAENRRATEQVARAADALAAHLAGTPRHVGMVRFNAFGVGGTALSFALALLDDHGTGVVLSSIYGREESRVYVKTVEAGVSPLRLTEEEKQAVRNARLRYAVGEGDATRGAK